MTLRSLRYLRPLFIGALLVHTALAQPEGGTLPTEVDSAAYVTGAETGTTTEGQVVIPGGDHVGFMLSFAGDIDADGIDDLLFGAYGNDSAAGDAGAVFVIAGRRGDTLRTLFGRHMHDDFGTGVAPLGDIDGDGRPDFAVGAPGVDGATEEELEVGCVYLYSGGDGHVIDSLFGSGPKARFGYAVAALGDLDGDGKSELGVAQRTGDDTDRSEYGAVLVFSGGTRSRLYAVEGRQVHDRFGSALASAGDVDGDGRPDLIVGAYRVSTALPSVGAVYLFSGSGGALLGEIDGRSLLGHFGFAVAGLGDLDGDGKSEYAVGARFDDEGGGRSGGVFVLSGTDGHRLRTLSGTEGAQFGSSVAAIGDLDGDGKSEFCVGAPRVGPEATGAAYVFAGADGKVLTTLSGEAAGDHFGIRVAGGGDANGDGVPDILVGAVGNDEGGVDAGKAYVYSGRDFALLQTFLGTSRVTAQDTARVARVMEAERALQAAEDTITVPDTVYDSSQVDVMPILRRSVNAEYPPAAFGSGLSGWVQVRILVLADGAPGRVDVVDDAGLGPDFRLAALKAARQWFFLPATRKGEPVPAWALFPIGFAPEEDSARASVAAARDSLEQSLPRPHAAAGGAQTPPGGDSGPAARATTTSAARDSVPADSAGTAQGTSPVATDSTRSAADSGATAKAADTTAVEPVLPANTSPDTASVIEPPAVVAAPPSVEVDPARIYEVADLDARPVLAAKTDPQYPVAARLAGDTCTVVIAATVDTSGAVTRVEVKSCSLPDKGFEESAKSAVRRWRFEPGLRGGRRVTFRIEYPVEFRL